jgi:hypothetical protein
VSQVQKTPFKEDMIALLHMSFSFRTEEHYDELLRNRVLSAYSGLIRTLIPV